MRVLIFSRNQKHHDDLLQTIRNLPTMAGRDVQICCVSDYDVLRRDLVKTEYDMVIVAEPGAYGMEVCIGTRKISHRLALVWFTDDTAFAAQSYRMNCLYFSELPVSERAVKNAFGRMAEQASMHSWRC